MTRLASPALGCKLRSVELRVGVGKETYDSEHFNEPLELSLEGQTSLQSDCGILSLTIVTGTRLIVRFGNHLTPDILTQYAVFHTAE
jgi:hypothetical protein